MLVLYFLKYIYLSWIADYLPIVGNPKNTTYFFDKQFSLISYQMKSYGLFRGVDHKIFLFFEIQQFWGMFRKDLLGAGLFLIQQMATQRYGKRTDAC